ncbi:g-type lectin s-receptor-like serine/threonine-protein kinase at1g11300 [Phtheirospermum japonicum]|uniref:G-type lectin s-receptor-like serine/threonine-protein kinase at1g11300 n=1 Tax=Phtheirospermum japonicum TaxID=374723 RepID=A0A830BXX0_9LAMI|nr:g-type lectin s-receptor-like serine/threonine-protein kinase at1g11300 [Phtheirospermum japonicum]
MEKEIEALKQQKRTDDDIITEMRRRVSESEIRDKKLREYNTKTIEGLRRQISACAEEIKTADRVREEMSLRESENVRRVEDLRRKNSEAAETVEGLRRRISTCEEEIKTADRVREEMKVREMESKRRLEDLERQKLEADKCMKEMKARESDLRRRILEADQSTLWNDQTRNWDVTWLAPQNECDVYGTCGAYGSCNARGSPICSCLRGFEPTDAGEWESGNWTRGCRRRRELECTGGGDGDGFFRMEFMKQFNGVGADLYIRLSASELDNHKDKKLVIIIPVVVGFVAICVLIFIGWCWMVKRKGV